MDQSDVVKLSILVQVRFQLSKLTLFGHYTALILYHFGLAYLKQQPCRYLPSNLSVICKTTSQSLKMLACSAVEYTLPDKTPAVQQYQTHRNVTLSLLNQLTVFRQHADCVQIACMAWTKPHQSDQIAGFHLENVIRGGSWAW